MFADGVQTVVDAKHKLIVAHEVTNSVTDQNQLSRMAVKAKEVLGVEELEVVADMGYYDGAEVKECLEARDHALRLQTGYISQQEEGIVYEGAVYLRPGEG